ncbi:zinc-binding dehydrogenase [Salipiger sp.]|uniref:zinc-binding dehydrogenase n=1 Tax=Salipiger sp. TaxID=2078585 RepID=UPI003A969397
MKTLICHGPGKITCEDVPDATIADQTGAVVKISLCAICGSDLHPYHVDMGRPAFCIGHEAVGEIAEVGREVRNFKVGDRVLIPAAQGCGKCRNCLAGHVQLCSNSVELRALGRNTPGIAGAQAEGIAIPMADFNLYHLPEDISEEVGLMLTDTLSTAWMAARRTRVAPGDIVAVIGLGAVGLQAVMSALAMGASRVLGIDLLPDRVEHGVKLGAEAVVGPDPVEAVREMTNGHGADVVIDANGGPVTTKLAIAMAAKGGRIGIVGISELPEIPFPIRDSILKSLEIHPGICSAQYEIPTLISQVRNGRMSSTALDAMFTHTMDLTKGPEAYEFFDKRLDGVLKVALDPSR